VSVEGGGGLEKKLRGPSRGLVEALAGKCRTQQAMDRENRGKRGGQVRDCPDRGKHDEVEFEGGSRGPLGREKWEKAGGKKGGGKKKRRNPTST